MVLPLVLLITMLVMITQLCTALLVRKRHLRLLPMYLLLGWLVLCVAGYLWSLLVSNTHLQLSCFLLGYVGSYWLAGAVLGWAAAAVVKTIQKRRK